MTIEERLSKLGPRHHHFEEVADPWHVRCLARRYPECLAAFNDQRVINGVGDAALHGGREVYAVWYSVDVNSELLQEWGFDAPPKEEFQVAMIPI